MARDDAPFMGGVSAYNAARSSAPQREALSVSAAVAVADSVLQEHTFRVVGEVSEFSNKPGYKAVYFTIKDERATLPCLMWNNRFKASGVQLQLGAKVEVTGKFTIFAPKGRMNFNVSQLTLAGDGALRQQVAQLAQKLKAEGLTDASRKRPVPFMPQTIGLVTSPRGAAVHDVLRTLRRRYPAARVVFAGVSVEGKRAAADLKMALEAVMQTDAEVILLVRGGGSYEDFMPFNDEALARAIAASPVPVVTGLGHELDTFIADMVADVRTTSPTAAAEAVTPHVRELNETFDMLATRMTGALAHRLRGSATYLNTIASRPVFKDPTSIFARDLQLVDMYQGRLERKGATMRATQATALDTIQERLSRAMGACVSTQYDRVAFARLRFERALPRFHEAAQEDIDRCSVMLRSLGQSLGAAHRHRVDAAQGAFVRLGKTVLAPYTSQAAVVTARLNDLSPLRALERGWSIVTNEAGAVVSQVDDVQPNDQVKVQLSDGALWCRVEEEAVSELSGVISIEEDLRDAGNE